MTMDSACLGGLVERPCEAARLLGTDFSCRLLVGGPYKAYKLYFREVYLRHPTLKYNMKEHIAGVPNGLESELEDPDFACQCERQSWSNERVEEAFMELVEQEIQHKERLDCENLDRGPKARLMGPYKEAHWDREAARFKRDQRLHKRQKTRWAV